MATKKSDTPQRRMCGAMEAHLRLCEIDPEFRVRRGKIHAATELMVRRGVAMRRVEKKALTIPVVMHVVYRTPGENISDAQIKKLDRGVEPRLQRGEYRQEYYSAGLAGSHRQCPDQICSGHEGSERQDDQWHHEDEDHQGFLRHG